MNVLCSWSVITMTHATHTSSEKPPTLRGKHETHSDFYRRDTAEATVPTHRVGRHEAKRYEDRDPDRFPVALYSTVDKTGETFIHPIQAPTSARPFPKTDLDWRRDLII